MAKIPKKPDGLSPELKKKLEEVESKVEDHTQIRRVKRLQELQKKLEESHKIERLKNIEKKILMPQFGVIVVLFPLLMILDGASISPLYLPLFYPLLMLFFWLLILCIEAFGFRLLELKNHPSKSVKWLMAKNSMKKAVPVIIVGLLIFGLFYTPYLSEEISQRSSMKEEFGLGQGDEKEIDIVSKCRFGFLSISDLLLETDGGSIEIELREADRTILYNATISDEEDVSENVSENILEEIPKMEFKELSLFFNNTSENDIDVEFTLEMEIEDGKLHWLSLLGFLYLASFTEWTAVLYPFKKKYSGAGIYH